MASPNGGGEVVLALLLAPFLAGFSTGFASFGSAICLQVIFSVFSLLNIRLYDDSTEQARCIIAIASILSFSQFPLSAWALYKSKNKHIMWEQIVYVFVGLNSFVWLGTYIGQNLGKPVILSILLGITLALIAIWQFFHQSILQSSIDDERVKIKYRNRILRQTYQNATQQQQLQQQQRQNSGEDLDDLAAAPTPNNPSGANSTTNTTNTPPLSIATAAITTNNATIATIPHATVLPNPSEHEASLYSIQINEPPKMPKALKAPNTNFDPTLYTQKMKIDRPPRHLGYSQLKINTNLESEELHNGADSSDDGLTRDESVLLHLSVYRLIKYRCQYQPTVVLLGLFFGSLAGLLGGLFGVNGPPLIVYFVLCQFSAAEIRDTAVIAFLTNIPISFIARVIMGIFRANEWWVYILSTLTSTAGLYLGRWTAPHCDTRVVMTFLQMIILLSSLPLTGPGVTSARGWVFTIFYLLIFIGLALFWFWRKNRNKIIKENIIRQHNVIHSDIL
eukprot:UN04791